MALANLTINVSTNATAARRGMEDISATAKASMLQSSAAVQAFQQDLNRSANDLTAASKQMGSGMRAANEMIISDSQRSVSAIDQMSTSVKNLDFKFLNGKISDAIGIDLAVAYETTKTWGQKTLDYVGNTAKTIGIGMAIAAVSATAGIVYSAYRIINSTLGFVKGLFTGDSYKSENINALIDANKVVLELQKNLNISAQEASALNDALARKGVSSSDYTAAQDGAAQSMRSNGDELDRLGIKYKSVNGQLLDAQKFLENVKAKLDEYTVGYDRNAAAASIGAGSYDQINQALKITQDELVKSKDRLDEYGLSMGPQSQKAVDDYVTAMREFNHESELTSQGFKRAVADNIMPVLTDLAVFFKDGFPSVVTVFRYSIASITSVFYVMKTGVYTVTESVLGSIESIAFGVGGLGKAMAKVFLGDFSGAKEAMLSGWEDAKKRLGDIGTNIVSQAYHNRDAMTLAWGKDDRIQSIADSKTAKVGKAWTPPPAAATEVKSPYAAYLDELSRMVKKVEENEYAAMRLKAAQLAQKEGITDLTLAYQKINAIQHSESQRAADEYVKKLKDETAQQKQQNDMLGLTSLQQTNLSYALQKRLDLENTIAQAKKSGKPLEEAAIKVLKDQTEATILLASVEAERKSKFEMKTEVDNYADKLRAETVQQKQQTDMLGLTTLQQTKLSYALQKRLDLENMISQAKKAGKPFDDAAAQALKDQTDATILLANAETERKNQIERSADFGKNKAVNDYLDSISNDAVKMGNVVKNTFQGMEDALASFVKTGKLDFSSMVDSIISDMIRMQIQQSITGPIAAAFQSGGFSGLVSAAASLLGFAAGGSPPVGVPSIVGEKGPELFIPKSAGTIIPNNALTALGGNQTTVHVSQSFTVGDVASVSMVRQAVAGSERRIAASISRSMTYGGALS